MVLLMTQWFDKSICAIMKKLESFKLDSAVTSNKRAAVWQRRKKRGHRSAGPFCGPYLDLYLLWNLHSECRQDLIAHNRHLVIRETDVVSVLQLHARQCRFVAVGEFCESIAHVCLVHSPNC